MRIASLRFLTLSFLPLSFFCLLIIATSGCKNGDGSSSGSGDRYLSIGTAPIGGAFGPVGGALSEVLNDSKGENTWQVQAKGTKGSQENIRQLDQGLIEFALSNAAISYFAARGEKGWDKKQDIKVVMTLAPNVPTFIAPKSAEINKIADLKGKDVIIGPAGAGFRMFVEPIIEAHGLKWEDMNVKHAPQSDAVDQLGDGVVAAVFIGGAVPTGSISQACSTFDLVFLPYEEEAMKELVSKYEFFWPVTIPGGIYSDLPKDFHTLNHGSMHVITSGSEDEETVYQVTKTIYEQREAMAKKHPVGKAIEKFASRQTGVDFHPGAIRYYKEIGIWDDGETAVAEETEEAEKAPAEDTPAKEAAPAEEAAK